jgi:hypothetical protein
MSAEFGAHSVWWVDLITAALGAGFGALVGSWISFDLERGRRKKETHDSNIAAANLALSQLFQYWYQLFSYKIECIEPVLKLDQPWLKGGAPYPKALGDAVNFDLKAISFLSIRDHDLLPTLLMVQTNHRLILDLLARRYALVNEISRTPRPPITGGGPRDEAYWTVILGTTKIHELKEIFKSISNSVNQEIGTASKTFQKLHDLMIKIYPKSASVIVSYDFDEGPVRARHEQIATPLPDSDTAPAPDPGAAA